MSEPIYLFKKTAIAAIKNNVLHVKNIRNHSHRSGKITQAYIDEEFDLKHLKETWLGLDGLKIDAFSHIYFIFVFNSKSLVVSVDAKRWTVQARPVLWGWLPIYPINYTLSTEKDIFEYRAIGMKRNQSLYKLKLSSKQSNAFLVEIVNRMNQVQSKNKKFNSIFRNCNTEVLKSLRRSVPEKFNSKFKSYFVTWIDHYFQQNGLIDSHANSKQELRKKHDVTHLVKSYKKKYGDFSKWIRKDL